MTNIDHPAALTPPIPPTEAELYENTLKDLDTIRAIARRARRRINRIHPPSQLERRWDDNMRYAQTHLIDIEDKAMTALSCVEYCQLLTEEDDA